jgi:hypothetical protein
VISFFHNYVPIEHLLNNLTQKKVWKGVAGMTLYFSVLYLLTMSCTVLRNTRLWKGVVHMASTESGI